MVWDYIVDFVIDAKDWVVESAVEVKDTIGSMFGDFGWEYLSDWLAWTITVPFWIGWGIMLWKVPMWKEQFGTPLIIVTICLMPFFFYPFAHYKIQN